MISVCMTSYNGEKYIKEQIDSIIKQLGPDDELIISDDGSKDNTCNIIIGYHDSRIRLLHNQTFHGLVGNFENALKAAKGDIIFLSDQDDIWKPNKINIAMKALGGYDLLLHDAEIVNSYGKSKGINYYSYLHSYTGFWANFWKTRFLGCCMVFRKEILRDALPFPRNLVGHDFWISSIALLKYKVVYIPDILLSYRRHGDNLSSSSEKSSHSLFYKVIEKRATMLWSLIRRLYL